MADKGEDSNGGYTMTLHGLHVVWFGMINIDVVLVVVHMSHRSISMRRKQMIKHDR